MPELPEVETVRIGLAGLISNSRIVSVDVRRDSAVRRMPGGPRQFGGLLTGLVLTAPVRRGKFLWIPLAEAPGTAADADTGLALSAHLGMSGQFRVHEVPTHAVAPLPHRHCRVRLTLSRAGVPLVLDFLDQRTFGYLHAEPMADTPDGHAGGLGSDLAAVPESVAHIGRDALDPALDEAAAIRGWRTGGRGIKQVMLDQTRVSGIGNIYADEALWHARLHPERPASALSRPQAATLLDATREVMSSALAQGGTSFDALYVNVNGESGYFSRDLAAYGRGGEPCLRCGRPLRRATVHGRSTHWCATCQRVHAPRRR